MTAFLGEYMGQTKTIIYSQPRFRDVESLVRGQRFGRFRIQHKIGMGRSSVVYRAVYEGRGAFRVPVALKVAKRGFEAEVAEEAEFGASTPPEYCGRARPCKRCATAIVMGVCRGH